MTKLRFLICGILFTASSSVFAGTIQVKYEGHYSIEKSSQVKHLRIAQMDVSTTPPENA